MRSLALRIVLVPLAIAAFGIFLCVPACNTLKEEARATAKSVVDCTIPAAVQAINEYAPTLEQVLVDAIDGQGKLDKDRVLDVTKSYATDTAKCVLASTIARLLAPPSSDPNAPQAAPLVVDLAGLEEVRKERLGSIRYNLPGGGTL